ncbi:MAG: hypothetical protein RJB34_370 [Pseudomonadota bacterium]
MIFRSKWRYLACVFCCSVLWACGGGGGGTNPPIAVQNLTVNVTGLESSALVLSDGTDQLSITADGQYAFAPRALQTAYALSVVAQPEGQFCALEAAGLAPLFVGEGEIQSETASLKVHCAPLTDLKRLYGRLVLNWVDADQTIEHYAVFGQAHASTDSFGPVLTTTLGSDTAWSIACSALDASATSYNPSYYLCILVNQNQDAHLMAFQLAGTHLHNGRTVDCPTTVAAADCAQQLRSAPSGSLTGGVVSNTATLMASGQSLAPPLASLENHAATTIHTLRSTLRSSR